MREYRTLSSLPSSSQHIKMSQEPLRRVSRLKKVKDTEDILPIRQASRLLGAQRGIAASSWNMSGSATRTWTGGAADEPATSDVRHSLGQSPSTFLLPRHLSPRSPSLCWTCQTQTATICTYLALRRSTTFPRALRPCPMRRKSPFRIIGMH